MNFLLPLLANRWVLGGIVGLALFSSAFVVGYTRGNRAANADHWRAYAQTLQRAHSEQQTMLQADEARRAKDAADIDALNQRIAELENALPKVVTVPAPAAAPAKGVSRAAEYAPSAGPCNLSPAERGSLRKLSAGGGSGR